MKYIDLHTHRFKSSGAFEIKNIFAQDFSKKEIDFPYSIGLHPWHVETADWNDCFQRIDEAAKEKNMLFVGECGLDRSIKTTFAQQEDCFRQQIQLAEIHGKPLIIHCVRAFNDLIRIKKETKSPVPWIIHGYSGNLETTFSLIKHGFYFSVGERLVNDERKHEILRTISCNSLFLETDESPVPIETIYQKVSAILNMDENELIPLIQNNFRSILKPDFIDY